MAKRRKRPEKSIISIEKQIELHGGKKEITFEEGKRELVDYYEKEIASMEKDRQRRRKILKKIIEK